MKNLKLIAVIATVAVVLVATLLAATAYAMLDGRGFIGMHGINTANTNGYYVRMMGNSKGMMGGYGENPEGTSGSGCGSYSASDYANNGTAIRINIAATQAHNYVAGLDNPDLTI